MNYQTIDFQATTEFDFSNAYEQNYDEYPSWSLDDFEDILELAEDAE